MHTVRFKHRAFPASLTPATLLYFTCALYSLKFYREAICPRNQMSSMVVVEDTQEYFDIGTGSENRSIVKQKVK